MRKPWFQFSLLTLTAGVVMAGCLVGANLLERRHIIEDVLSPNVSFIVSESGVTYGWPCDAAFRELYSDLPGVPLVQTLRNHYRFTHILWNGLLADMGVCLTVLLAGVYTVEWIVRVGTRRVAVTQCRGLKLTVAAIIALILSVNYERPFYIGDLIGVCWGWPQAFVQSSPGSKIVLFSTFALLADLVFAFAVLGVATRLCAWVLRNDMTVVPPKNAVEESGHGEKNEQHK